MKRDHSKLIRDIGELTALFRDTATLDSLLQNIVEMIAANLEADVCSIYLYDEGAGVLVLKATKGLKPESVGNVRLRAGEGLAGIAFAELRPVCEGDAQKHPGFHHVPGIGEEKFCSFVAVPILRGQTRIGVMTLQSVRKNYFTPEDVNIFRAVTSQLATTIEMARLLMSRGAPPPDSDLELAQLKFIKGRVGAEGFALAESVVVAPPTMDDVEFPDAGLNYTVDDFRCAVEVTEKELTEMQNAVEEKLFDVASLIFSAQILMLKDQSLLETTENLIRGGLPPPMAVRSVIQDYVSRFDRMPSEYMREKRYDVIDMGRRLLKNLASRRGERRERRERRPELSQRVVIARELLPSDVLKLSLEGVAGVVLLSGGVTSHVAVLARSLNIPLIIADESRLLLLKNGTRVLLDGYMGNIFVEPAKDVVRAFREKEELRADAKRIRSRILAETRTSDGVRITLLANINLLGDLAVARDFKAEGVGLYRTEFPFLVRSDFPTEEEQYLIYRRLVDEMKGREITFRTLDIGGDKMVSYYDYSKEANPFLGLRSIRFSLRHRPVFLAQLRAILRASRGAKVRIMFPMISSVDEFVAARTAVEECVAGLKADGVEHQAEPQLGAMIEVPSVLEVIDELAAQADFLSVGTNDLIQYMLAVDRTNEKVADLYLPYHPAVLRGLKRVTEAALRHGRDVSVCGDMAHDPRYVPFLVGIGVRKFSLDARYLPKVQETIVGLSMKEAERIATMALESTSIAVTRQVLEGEAS